MEVKESFPASRTDSMTMFRLRKSVLTKGLNYLLVSLTLWSFLNVKVLSEP